MRRTHSILLAFAFLAALVLRVVYINSQSLWLDEIYTMNMVAPSNTFADIYTLSKTTDPLSLLYFLLGNVIVNIFNYSEVTVRLVSVIFGMCGVWFIYLLGKEIRDRETGVIAALLLSVNFFHIQYSQEARVYTMYSAFTCLAFYFLVRFLKAPALKTAGLYGCGALLMLYSHFFGIFALIAQVIILGIYFFKPVTVTRTHFVKLCLVSAGIVFIGYLPILPILKVVSGQSGTWIPPIKNDAFGSLYSEFFGHSFFLITLSVVLVINYLLFIFSLKNQNGSGLSQNELQAFYILTLWILVSFLLPYFQSYHKFPILSPRYMISLLPAVILVIALGVNEIKDNLLRAGTLFTFMILSVFELTLVNKYYTLERKSDFRAVSTYLIENNQGQSRIFTSLPYHFNYYFKKAGNLAEVRDTPIDSYLEEVRSGTAEKEAFWLIEGHNRKFNPGDSSIKFLKENYEEVKVLEKFEAWTRYFVPVQPVSQSLINSLRSKDFGNSGQKINDIYLFNNDKISSMPVNLGPGKYKLVVKAQSLPANYPGAEYARLTVYFGDNRIKTYYLNQYSYLKGDTLNMNLKYGQTKLFVVAFENDSCSGAYDRNMALRELLVLKDESTIINQP